MKWHYQTAEEAQAGEAVLIKCAKCGKLIEGMNLCYFANPFTDEEAKQLETLFNVDPFGGSYQEGNVAVFCEECIDGYCGLANSRLNADTWLQKQIEDLSLESDPL